MGNPLQKALSEEVSSLIYASISIYYYYNTHRENKNNNFNSIIIRRHPPIIHTVYFPQSKMENLLFEFGNWIEFQRERERERVDRDSRDAYKTYETFSRIFYDSLPRVESGDGDGWKTESAVSGVG